MRHNLRSIGLFICLLGLAGCAGSVQPGASQDNASADDLAKLRKLEQMEQRTACPPEPGWVLGKGHPNFPSAKYLIGVGISAESPSGAKDTATAELAKNIKVNIQSVMKDFVSTEGTYAESAVKTVVDAALEGVERKDGYFDKCRNQYYALVVMDRELEAGKLQQRIAATESILKQHLDQGREAENKGELIQALSHYLEGYELAPTLVPQRSTLAVIARSAPSGDQALELSQGAFRNHATNLIRNVRLDAVSGDKQTIKSFQLPADALVAAAYIQTDFGNVALKGLPIRFQFEKGQGTLNESVNTNEEGQARASVVKIDNYEADLHRIAVRLDYDRLASGINPRFKDSFLAPLQHKGATFHYTIQKIEGFSGKSHAWRQGLVRLAETVIKNVKPDTTPVVGVIQFEDTRSKKVTPFTEILVEDFKAILAQAGNLSLKEIALVRDAETDPHAMAKEHQLDFYVNGSYRMERAGLQIIAKLIDVQSNTYLGSGSVLMDRGAISPEDLKVLETSPSSGSSGIKDADEEYRQELDKLVYAQPKNAQFAVQVWTNQKEYEIGDQIVFSVKAERDSYLTLFDIGSGGDATVIFPNAFHKDNFIRAGRTYEIPAPEYGFKFNIEGPAGLERVKAIATLEPGLPVDLDLAKGFHTFKRGSREGTRDISIIADTFTQGTDHNWAESHTEIFIFKRNDTYTRGIRKIPIKEDPEKPIDMIGTFGREPAR
ncbi:DUF4384 domain-containing protein [Nitrospina watsonii]|uniref:DUF4384 domain-containing protein n=1 Tax=Nitrospina watsonii TaxID=1323948 RepID=A0ABM9HA10_9BACT|nr:DUF4384 domain-containing protein [Nitrospina watsonii]CAI2716977.1 conserved exported protein of unknown function [Nitrospina watsonii]